MKHVLFAAAVAVLSFNVGAYTTQSYKRTGLIAQWDAIENSINTDGDGCHDPEATVWKDLSGNGADFNLSGFFGNQLNCWSTTSLVAKSCYNVPCAKSCKDYVTIEICAKHNKQ